MRKQALFATCAVLLSLFAHGRSVAATNASDDPWTQSFFVLMCNYDPGPTTLNQEQFPPFGCQPPETGSIQLKTTEGYVVDSCFVGSTGTCDLSGETNASYIYEFVGGSIPEGYVPRDNPGLFNWSYTFSTGIVFVPDWAIPSTPETATVTFHSRDCPVDYVGSDIYGDCHGRLPDFRQVIEATGSTGRATSSDDAGNSELPGLTEGAWWFEPSLARDTSRVEAFCSEADSPGVEFDRYTTLDEERRFHIGMDLLPGDSIVCDLYRIPGSTPASETALLTLRMRSCQKLESPEQIYADCFDGPIENMFQMGDNNGFLIDGYTDPDGEVTLELPPGSYWASGIYGHNIAASYTYCSQIGMPDSGIETIPELSAGEHWICDIYTKRESFR